MSENIMPTGDRPRIGTLRIDGPLARADLPGLFARANKVLECDALEVLRCEIAEILRRAAAQATWSRRPECDRQSRSTTMNLLPSGSRKKYIGGTGSPMRMTSASTSTPCASMLA
jgi:hypothetical protein